MITLPPNLDELFNIPVIFFNESDAEFMNIRDDVEKYISNRYEYTYIVFDSEFSTGNTALFDVMGHHNDKKEPLKAIDIISIFDNLYERSAIFLYRISEESINMFNIGIFVELFLRIKKDTRYDDVKLVIYTRRNLIDDKDNLGLL